MQKMVVAQAQLQINQIVIKISKNSPNFYCIYVFLSIQACPASARHSSWRHDPTAISEISRMQTGHFLGHFQIFSF